ncbi:MAG: hypothetical protein IJ471_01480 [Eubacterium sp.]|nr:hypothetical protein [Eubacterium sp.]
MSNKDVAIYMIPAGCLFMAAVTLESKPVLALVLLLVAGIAVYAKKKTSVRLAPRADVKSNKTRAYCSTERRVIQ